MKNSAARRVLTLGLVLFSTVVLSAQERHPWDGSPGPLEVQRIDRASIRDASRERSIVASILIPEGEGPFPLIVFSHGYGGSKDAYQRITTQWASHGYVVIQPTHADSGAIQSIGDLFEVRDIWKNERPPQWKDRVADLSLVVDSIDGLERRHRELRGKVDRTRIGVAGHSYGALTTELIAGTTSFAENPPLELLDDRVDAAIAMSPEGRSDDLGFTGESFSTIAVPMMFMSGSLDRAAGGHPAEWRKEAFEYASSGGKYLVFIEGARHASFSGRLLDQKESSGRRRGVRRNQTGAGLFGSIDLEKEARILSWINGASLAFWDATLKESAAARQFLASDALVEASDGAVELKRK